MRKIIFFILQALILNTLLFSNKEDILGYWLGRDEQTNEPNSIIFVYEKSNKIYGKIIAIIRGEKYYTAKNPSGALAKGVSKATPLENLEIIWDLEERAGENYWYNGKILDPQSGKIYDLELWREADKLYTKGKVWVFGKTKVWQEIKKENLPSAIDNKLVMDAIKNSLARN